jgi:hypothetical protein
MVSLIAFKMMKKVSLLLNNYSTSTSESKSGLKIPKMANIIVKK